MPASNHSSFLQATCPSCRPSNSVKALKTVTREEIHCKTLCAIWVSLDFRNIWAVYCIGAAALITDLVCALFGPHAMLVEHPVWKYPPCTFWKATSELEDWPLNSCVFICYHSKWKLYHRCIGLLPVRLSVCLSRHSNWFTRRQH